MKRILSGLGVAIVALATAALPATANPATEENSSDAQVHSTIGSITWLEDTPEFPVDLGTPPASLTPEDKIALAEFEKEFPWKEAFASFGCQASNITFNDEGGKSMLLDCADASIPLDEVGQVPTTAIAAAEGYSSAVDALRAGTIVDTDALNMDI